MAVEQNINLVIHKELCDIFGIDPSRVFSMSVLINAEPNSLVTCELTVRGLLDRDQTSKVVSLLKKYKLTEVASDG